MMPRGFAAAQAAYDAMMPEDFDGEDATDPESRPDWSADEGDDFEDAPSDFEDTDDAPSGIGGAW